MSTEETRWLTAAEQRAWRAFLTACQTLFSTVDAQLARDANIPHGYYEILVRLSETPGRALRMTQLAEASTSSKSRLSHAVARLEQRGWVKRTDCATDRRGQVAQLTDDGFAALAAAAPGHVAQVRRSLIDQLTPEQIEQLREISELIIVACGAEAPAGGGCADTMAEAELAEDGRCGDACADANRPEDGACETASAC
ncbi:MAG TPA: MarR family transcriptional regulator [Streptosporangiaceae bacterium]|nr:MarR family transcriptional regulator [Streptosporangiaceae bacterium]